MLLDTDRLAELLEHKHVRLAQLRVLAGRQRELIAAGDMNELLALLSAKQTLIGELQSLERDLDPYRDQDPETRPWRSPSERARCQQLNDDSGRLLEELLSLERAAELDMQQRRDEAAARLQWLGAASQAHNAYTDQAAPLSGQLDLSTDA
jgi:flagellar biosynthesis/type III secretory pathway chaperone